MFKTRYSLSAFLFESPAVSLMRSVFALMLLMTLLLPAIPAYAAVALITGERGFPQVSRLVAYGDITGTPTFATTVYADLTGSSFTYTPTFNDCTTAARLSACLIEVAWTVDGTKATATTGICAVFVNGAIVASSARTVAFVTSATEDNIGGDFVFANTTVGAQTIKLQCKSGDTNVFTVNFGHMVVKEIVPAVAR